MEEVRPLSWIGLLVILIIVLNAVFFGTLAIFSYLEDRRIKKQNEQRRDH